MVEAESADGAFEPGEGDMETDLAAIETAVDALNEDGLDAEEDLEGAIKVLDGLDETAAEGGHDSPETEEAHMELVELRNDVQAVAEGDEPSNFGEEELVGALTELGALFVQAALEHAITSAMDDGPVEDFPSGL